MGGKDLSGITAGSSEHFGLPAAFPQLRDVDVYLGWFGPMSRPIQGFSAVMAGVQKIPGASSALNSVVGRFVKGSTGGPDEQERSKSGSRIVAIASDAGGRQLSEVRVEGVDGYTFTARMLAWSAMQAVDGGVARNGRARPGRRLRPRTVEGRCRRVGPRRGRVTRSRASAFLERRSRTPHSRPARSAAGPSATRR